MLIDYCGVVYSICFPKELWIKASAKCLKYGLGYLTMDSECTLRQKHCVHNITVHLFDMTHLTPVNKSESKPKKRGSCAPTCSMSIVCPIDTLTLARYRGKSAIVAVALLYLRMLRLLPPLRLSPPSGHTRKYRAYALASPTATAPVRNVHRDPLPSEWSNEENQCSMRMEKTVCGFVKFTIVVIQIRTTSPLVLRNHQM